jgi:hypothetical protein
MHALKLAIELPEQDGLRSFVFRLVVGRTTHESS